MFAAGTYHKAGDILHEYQRYLFLIAVHDKSGGLIRAVVINDAPHLHFTLFSPYDLSLVGDDAYGPALDTRIATENGLSIIFLELFEGRVIHDTLDDLQHVVWFCSVFGHDAV